MKKIIVLQDFQDAGQQFYAGETRIVTIEKSGYYCGLGWANDGETAAIAQPENVVLSVNDGIHFSSASSPE